MLPHRRKAPRRRVLKTGSIEFADTTIECMVRELSGGGAVVELVSPLPIPDRFTLFIPSEQSKRSCRIIWRKGKRIGIAFKLVGTALTKDFHHLSLGLIDSTGE